MAADLWLPLTVVFLCFGVGLILTILPVFPGPVLVFAGVAIFYFWKPDHSPGTVFVLICLGLVLLSLVLDVVLSVMGARRYGATWKGAVGALIGGVVGIFLPPPLLWIFVGPIVGAVAGELLGGRKIGPASRAGWGTLLGTLVAMAAKIAVSFFIMIGFTYLLLRSG